MQIFNDAIHVSVTNFEMYKVGNTGFTYVFWMEFASPALLVEDLEVPLEEVEEGLVAKMRPHFLTHLMMMVTELVL